MVTTNETADPDSGLDHVVLFAPTQSGTFKGLSFKFMVYNNGSNNFVVDDPPYDGPWPYGCTHLWMIYRRRAGQNYFTYPPFNAGPIYEPAEDLLADGLLNCVRGPMGDRLRNYQMTFPVETDLQFNYSGWESTTNGTVGLVAGTGGPIDLITIPTSTGDINSTSLPDMQNTWFSNEVGGSTTDREKGKTTLKRRLSPGDDIVLSIHYNAHQEGLQAGVTFIGSVSFYYAT